MRTLATRGCTSCSRRTWFRAPAYNFNSQLRQTTSTDCSSRPFGSQLRQTTSIDSSDTQLGLIVPPVRRSGQRAGCLPTRGQPCSSRRSSRRPAPGFILWASQPEAQAIHAGGRFLWMEPARGPSDNVLISVDVDCVEIYHSVKFILRHRRRSAA
jgi:hypothetical protein